MMRPDMEPTEDQLLAMAFADGELGEDSTSTFEARLAGEPQLAREVSDYQALQILGRQMAPPEPMDYEWERIAHDPVLRTGVGLGWLFVIVGLFGGSAFSIFEVVRSDMPIVPKGLVLCLIAGFLLLLSMTARARWRTLPFDPYRKVQR
jgi:hypothetical protein